jgi:hypothetical protein
MASKEVAPKRKLRPARKQVEAGDIDKTEAIQPGKEYSMFNILHSTCSNDQISGTINGLVEIKRMLLPSELFLTRWKRS